MCETDDKKWIKTQFKSSQTFHQTSYKRVLKTTVCEQLKLENLELFVPTAQDNTGLHPASIHTIEKAKSMNGEICSRRNER
jgi:hypothetical protein